MKTLTAGKILVALSFASMIGGISVGAALAGVCANPPSDSEHSAANASKRCFMVKPL